MAGRGDIEAGKAFVRLYVKDSMTRALKSSMLAATAAVSSVAAGAAAAVREFVAFGSAINDASARTGVAAGQLQHLKFAAEQTGATIGDVEIALRTMARKGLGNDIEVLATRINAIHDPAQRAAAAIDAFGKSGTKMLPMLAEWKNLKAASEALGPVLTDDEVRLADELGDKFAALSEAMKRAMMQIGVSLGPHLKNILDGAIGMVVKFNRALSETNEAGRGGDWLDKAAEFLRTPLSEFVKTGAAAPAPQAPRAGGMDADEAERRTRERATKHEDIMRGINRGYEARNALIRESWTEAERFRAKEQEILRAITAANNNRVLGAIDEATSRQQIEGLKITLARVRAEEDARRAAMRPVAPEIKKPAAVEARLPDARELIRNVSVGFTAAGLAAAGGGARDATVSELKKVGKQLEASNRLLAGIKDKPAGMRAV